MIAALLLLAAVHDIGARKQLFLDHQFIEAAEGVTLTMNTPVRASPEPLVTADAPWETGLATGSYSSIRRENGKTRLWYNIRGVKHEAGRNPEFMGVAYAESSDGLRFEKPRLGLVEHEGSRANNLVMPHDPKLLAQGGGSVAFDENPACPPAERYKSWQKIYPKAGTGIRGPHRLFVSPDGLRWKLHDKLFTGLRAADTQPTWFWDAARGRYVGYSREWVQFAGGGRIRMASFNESTDMFAWSNMQIALEPDEADYAALPRPYVDLSRMTLRGENLTEAAPVPRPTPEAATPASAPQPYADQVPPPGAPVDVYGPGVFPYEGAYLALEARFHHWRMDGRHSWPDTGDVQLAVSRDGIHFHRPSREPFLSTGMTGAWDSKWIWPMPRPIPMGDELWIYYFGTNVAHGRIDASETPRDGIGRMVLRLDGFVSANFAATGGTLMTPPLRFDGKALELNLDTGAGGVARVEILDERGFPLPGYAMREADDLNVNSVRARAAWRGGQTDVSALAGKPVRLRFKMRAAKLYAFQFR
ncbi:MAG: hypothetical protein IT162_12275 [Bryobacterales bacterium]|nr:hypothetical protein [Bryobacterales bacterium]